MGGLDIWERMQVFYFDFYCYNYFCYYFFCDSVVWRKYVVSESSISFGKMVWVQEASLNACLNPDSLFLLSRCLAESIFFVPILFVLLVFFVHLCREV